MTNRVDDVLCSVRVSRKHYVVAVLKRSRGGNGCDIELEHLDNGALTGLNREAPSNLDLRRRAALSKPANPLREPIGHEE